MVLPGLDVSLSEDAWVRIDDQHPQGALKRLLDRVTVARGAVLEWPACDRGAAPRAARGDAPSG